MVAMAAPVTSVATAVVDFVMVAGMRATVVAAACSAGTVAMVVVAYLLVIIATVVTGFRTAAVT